MVKAKQENLIIDSKAKKLLSQMTTEEKIAQLGAVSGKSLLKSRNFSYAMAKKYLKNGIGQISRTIGEKLPTPLSPREAAQINNHIQRYLITETRLGIPAIVHEECLSGVMGFGGTVFPQAIALGCTWNPDLVYRITDTIRRQLRSVGCHQGLAPVLDVQRDARWGRTEETISEDHYLVSVIGSAYIKGLQGEDLKEGVLATIKHFAGHGAPEGGRNLAPAHLTPREFHEVFLYPFEVAVRYAGAYSLMNAYHDVDGVTCAASRELLTEILRQKWGFEGIIVSDYGAIRMVWDFHHIARNLKEAAVATLEAGLDIELPNTNAYGKPLMEALKEGLISESTIDESVLRVLKVKFLLDLFESPYVDIKKAEKIFDTPADRALALEAARQSIVLLKNKNNTLPISKKIKSIAVIGPSAESTRNMFGDYNYTAHMDMATDCVRMVSVLEGIKKQAGNRIKINYAKGCELNDYNTGGFDEARSIALKSDLIIAVVGEKAGLFGKGLSGEGCDRESLRLPGVQEEMLKNLKKAGKPIVVVLINGRPISSSWIKENCDAVIEAWYPGEEGGKAIAEILFGNCNPGAKLAHTVPLDAGQIPVNYNRKPTSYNKYVTMQIEPLYPFGHGLSYTAFEYSNLKIEPRNIYASGMARISLYVKNAGTRRGDEVVQLYVKDEVASLVRPAIELKGFKRITLNPGQRKKVTFILSMEQLSFLDKNMELVVEPGAFKIMAGSSSDDIRLKGTLRVVGDKKIVPQRNVFFSEVSVK